MQGLPGLYASIQRAERGMLTQRARALNVDPARRVRGADAACGGIALMQARVLMQDPGRGGGAA